MGLLSSPAASSMKPSLRRQSLPRGTFDHRGTLLAIVIVGALVLVEVTASITEASMTLSPLERHLSYRQAGLVEMARCVEMRAAMLGHQHHPRFHRELALGAVEGRPTVSLLWQVFSARTRGGPPSSLLPNPLFTLSACIPLWRRAGALAASSHPACG
jgi:hypothetical protein